jgi:hypothetical protein
MENEILRLHFVSAQNDRGGRVLAQNDRGGRVSAQNEKG